MCRELFSGRDCEVVQDNIESDSSDSSDFSVIVETQNEQDKSSGQCEVNIPLPSVVPPCVEPRRSERSTAGRHTNPYRVPRSSVRQVIVNEEMKDSLTENQTFILQITDRILSFAERFK